MPPAARTSAADFNGGAVEAVPFDAPPVLETAVPEATEEAADDPPGIPPSEPQADSAPTDSLDAAAAVKEALMKDVEAAKEAEATKARAAGAIIGGGAFSPQ